MTGHNINLGRQPGFILFICSGLLAATLACNLPLKSAAQATATSPAIPVTATRLASATPLADSAPLATQPSVEVTIPPPTGDQPTLVLSPTLQSTTPPAIAGPVLAGCSLFPADHILNTRIDWLPVDPRSEAYIASIGADASLHPDFGSGTWEGSPIGIPYNVVASSQVEAVALSFEYGGESDPGPYPIPSDPAIEGGSDHHLLLVDADTCRLFEIYAARQRGGGGWAGGSGAVWDLNSYLLRPDTWTSADAAGLPILPLLVRYEEVAAGWIGHAIRFTAERTQRATVWPARHYASSITDPDVPPMGQRFRLKASFNLAPYPPEVQVILRAMQMYGLILADNGSDWYITGAPDARWNDEMLVEAFGSLRGSDFEAVDVSGLMIEPDSGQSR